MPDEPSAESKAIQSLRETAKWLVGGTAATAAAVFAGSSLTSIGALDPSRDFLRLAMAILGLVTGFGGLAIVLDAALRVLVAESRTPRDLARAQGRRARPSDAKSAAADEELAWMGAQMDARFAGSYPAGLTSFVAYSDAVDQAYDRDRLKVATPEDLALLARAKLDFPAFLQNLGFLAVRRRFDQLIVQLYQGLPLAAIGFGLFAWAANPPPPSAPQTSGLHIRLDWTP